MPKTMPRKTPDFRFDLFLSFSSRDRVIEIQGKQVRLVDELKRALESHNRRAEGGKGARLRFRVCTYEEDFELEETVQGAMRETIRNCSSLLVVTSKSSAQSSHVRFELQTFRDLHGARGAAETRHLI
jgi:hypothetical protein